MTEVKRKRTLDNNFISVLTSFSLEKTKGKYLKVFVNFVFGAFDQFKGH